MDMKMLAAEQTQITELHASRLLRGLYCISLLSLLPVMMMGGMGWIGMMTGGGLLPGSGVIWILLIIWRIVYVIFYKNALIALRGNVFILILRRLGIFAMSLGILLMPGFFFRHAIVDYWHGDNTDDGIVYLLFGMGIYLASLASLLAGLGIFELSRLLAGKPPARPSTVEGS